MLLRREMSVTANESKDSKAGRVARLACAAAGGSLTLLPPCRACGLYGLQLRIFCQFSTRRGNIGSHMALKRRLDDERTKARLEKERKPFFSNFDGDQLGLKHKLTD